MSKFNSDFFKFLSDFPVVQDSEKYDHMENMVVGSYVNWKWMDSLVYRIHVLNEQKTECELSLIGADPDEPPTKCGTENISATNAEDILRVTCIKVGDIVRAFDVARHRTLKKDYDYEVKRINSGQSIVLEDPLTTENVRCSIRRLEPVRHSDDDDLNGFVVNEYVKIDGGSKLYVFLEHCRSTVILSELSYTTKRRISGSWIKTTPDRVTKATDSEVCEFIVPEKGDTFRVVRPVPDAPESLERIVNKNFIFAHNRLTPRGFCAHLKYENTKGYIPFRYLELIQRAANKNAIQVNDPVIFKNYPMRNEMGIVMSSDYYDSKSESSRYNIKMPDRTIIRCAASDLHKETEDEANIRLKSACEVTVVGVPEKFIFPSNNQFAFTEKAFKVLGDTPTYLLFQYDGDNVVTLPKTYLKAYHRKFQRYDRITVDGDATKYMAIEDESDKMVKVVSSDLVVHNFRIIDIRHVSNSDGW